jgi:hypothetical protein
MLKEWRKVKLRMKQSRREVENLTVAVNRSGRHV